MSSSHPPNRLSLWTAHRRAIGVLMLLAIGGSVACSLIVDVSRRQCTTNADCAGHGLKAGAICSGGVCVENDVTSANEAGADVVVVDEQWGCTRKVAAPPAADASSPIGLSAKFVTLGNSPAADLSVRWCQQDDPDCILYTGEPKKTNAEGRVDIPLYDGFRGYLEVTPPPESSIIPALTYLQPVPDRRRGEIESTPREWLLFSKLEFDAFFAVARRSLNPTAGHLTFSVRDCQRKLAPDMRIRAEPLTTDAFAFYSDPNGVPSLTQGRTSVRGSGGYLNLPPGSVTVELSFDSGALVSTHAVLIRPGTITQLDVGPKVDVADE